MENKSKRFAGPPIIAAYVLTCIEIAMTIFLLTQVSSFGEVAVLLVEVAAKLLAIFYFAKGFGKNENRYFRWYFLLLAATILIEDFFCIFLDYGTIAYSEAMIMMMTEAICYGNCFVIGIAKDLGKRKSVTLMSTSVAIHIYEVFSYAAAYGRMPSDTGFVSLIANISWLLGAVVGLIMVFAKYADKASRETK